MILHPGAKTARMKSSSHWSQNRSPSSPERLATEVTKKVGTCSSATGRGSEDDEDDDFLRFLLLGFVA